MNKKKELINHILKKNFREAYGILLSNSELDIKEGNNLLHMSVLDKSLKLTKLLVERYPHLFYELNNRNETILFKLIKEEYDISFCLYLINNFKTNQANIDGINILDIAISKNNETLINYLLKKWSNISPINYQNIYKNKINLPKKFYPKELLNFYPKKILYIPKEILSNIEESPLGYKLIDCIKENNYTTIFLSYLTKKTELNIDLSRNFINSQEYKLLWFNDKELEIYINLILKLKQEYKDSRIFTLLNNSIFDEDIIKQENFINSLTRDILKKIKKPKYISDIQRQYHIEISLNSSKIKNTKLNQKINIFNNINIQEYTIHVPNTLSELAQASKALRICVGQGDYYANKVLEFQSQILFLNKNNEIHYCVEIDPSRFFQIIQAEGLFGKNMPQDLVDSLQKIIDTRMGKYLN